MAFPLTADQFDAITTGNGKLFLIGYVVYEDDAGVRRHMAFGREYDRTSRRFRIIDDPNYEYGD